jgi:hypothetical protein
MRAPLHRVAPPYERRAVDPVPHHEKADIILLLGSAQEPLGILERLRHIAAHVGDDPLPVHHGKRVFVIAELGAELRGSGIILGQFRSDVTTCRDQGTTQFDSRHEFARVALAACRQQPKEFDDAIAMTCRLTIGRAPDREVACFLPPLQRDFGQAGVGAIGLPFTVPLKSAAAICAAMSEPGPVGSEYRLLISESTPILTISLEIWAPAGVEPTIAAAKPITANGLSHPHPQGPTLHVAEMVSLTLVRFVGGVAEHLRTVRHYHTIALADLSSTRST